MNLTMKKSNIPQHLLKYFTVPKSPYKAGDLVDTPHIVALALQADGWILRSDIPWVKRSPMPESVQNRPAKSLEYVFMLVKRMGYFYDNEAVKRVSQEPTKSVIKEGGRRLNQVSASTFGTKPSGNSVPGSVVRTGDRRNFWQADLWFESVDKPHGLTRIRHENSDGSWEDEIVGIDATSQGYPGSHFAVYPPALIEPFIKAGTSEYGCCADCGAPWERVLEREKLTRERPNQYVKYAEERGIKSGLNKDRKDGGRSNVGSVNSCANDVAGVETKTVGWRPRCECHGKLVKRKVVYELRSEEIEYTVIDYVSDLPLDQHPVVPCTVLDPFLGSGTTAVVALEHGRRCVGIDLSEKYLRENAIPRIEGQLLGKPDTASLVKRESVGPVRLGKPVESRGLNNLPER